MVSAILEMTILIFTQTFADMNNPVPMIQLGETGDIGSIELSDLLFTVKGPTAGVTLVEWNLSAAEQGGAAMWGKYSLFYYSCVNLIILSTIT